MLWCGGIILTPPREWWHMGWSSHLTPGPETQSSSNLHNTPAAIWPTILHAALGKNNMKMWSLQSLNVNQLRIHFVVGFLHVWCMGYGKIQMKMTNVQVNLHLLCTVHSLSAENSVKWFPITSETESSDQQCSVHDCCCWGPVSTLHISGQSSLGNVVW